VEEDSYYNGSIDYESSDSVSYNSDGTITISNSDSNSVEYTYQLDNQGNIIRGLWEDDDCEEIVSVNYDDNNTPFKNITGANSINVIYGLFSDSQLRGFFNNIKVIQFDVTCNNSSNNESYTTNFSYDYTQDGYPRNIVATETEDGEQYTTTIILEYN
jgi:hypothetical protein